MPFLKLLREPWTEHAIDRDAYLIGRDSRKCDFVLGDRSVSRQHAQITEASEGYFLADLGSQSGTLLNGQRLESQKKYALADQDVIQICNYSLSFTEENEPGNLLATINSDEDNSSIESSSSILESSIDSWSRRANVNAEEKLRGTIALSKSLRACDSLDDALSRILGSMLDLFRQAQRGVIFLVDETIDAGKREVVRCRHDDTGEDTTSSPEVRREFVDEVVERQVSVISDDRRHAWTPLIDSRNTVLGLVQLDAGGLHYFKDEDLDLLSTLAVEASIGLENWLLQETAARDRELQYELKIAEELQRSLLPVTSPEIDGYDFYHYYAAARQVGGDHYDYVPVANNNLGFLLGDVAGKGVPAALLMAKVASETGVYLAANLNPSRVVEQVNARLCEHIGTGRFVTLVAAVLDLTAHEVVFVNAGHMPPLLRRDNGEVAEVAEDQPGLPLGVEAGERYAETRVQLAPGDALILYTDGVTDATSSTGESYGRDRLLFQLASGQENAAQLGTHVMQDVQAFVDGQEQTDDICLLVVHRQASCNGPA